jgi:hypothetical protein
MLFMRRSKQPPSPPPPSPPPPLPSGAAFWARHGHVDDPKLELIAAYLEAYRAPLSDGWDRLAAAGQLYFLTGHWLKLHAGPSGPTRAALHDLFCAVCDHLCSLYGCPLALLPRRIEDTWGRRWSVHGINLERTSDAVAYLARSDAEKHRLSFFGGLAYQASWWQPGPRSFALADTVGWSGFVLSRSRELYVARDPSRLQPPPGDPVLCRGALRIHAGVVEAIADDSGHLARTLRLHGVRQHHRRRHLG